MPILFISRGTMSGVHQVVKCLNQRTGIRIVSHENLTQIINRHGELATRIVEGLDTGISEYDRFSGMRWPYLVLLRQALLEEVRVDNMVYDGYSAHFLLPGLQHFIRARIDAPMPMRLKMTMERMRFDENAARCYINDADQQRVRMARLLYARDIRDPRFYDLHINLGHISLNAVCGLLERAISEEEFQTRPETKARVEQLLLAANVEAALVSDERTHHFEISAKMEETGIQLSGPYLEDDDLTMVMDIAENASGVKNVSYTPGYAPSIDAFSNQS